MHHKLTELTQLTGIEFNNIKLLQQAFTHASSTNELKKRKLDNNERLEFLGDAVLELVVSDYLYRNNADINEGELTKLRASIVCETSLFFFAENLQFSNYVILGKGEELTGGRKRASLLADVFEAYVGALYLDQGMDAVQKFISQHVFKHLNNSRFPYVADYKTNLQEWLQEKGNLRIDYRIVEEKGPAHNKIFTAALYIDDKFIAVGKGKTKKEAEQEAAKTTLQRLYPDGI